MKKEFSKESLYITPCIIQEPRKKGNRKMGKKECFPVKNCIFNSVAPMGRIAFIRKSRVNDRNRPSTESPA